MMKTIRLELEELVNSLTDQRNRCLKESNKQTIKELECYEDGKAHGLDTAIGMIQVLQIQVITHNARNPWCSTMNKPSSECGCPDCGSTLIDYKG